jgi:hypothetical protein
LKTGLGRVRNAELGKTRNDGDAVPMCIRINGRGRDAGRSGSLPESDLEEILREWAAGSAAEPGFQQSARCGL